MNRRSAAGFTLLELVVAIVVTSIVALLAWATLSAGIDTQERVDRSDAAIAEGVGVRAFLMDALRHLPENGGAAMNEALFTLEDRASAAGLPNDALSFVSYGIGPDPGASAPWSVTLAAAVDGVRLRAIALDEGEGAPIDILLPEVRGLEASVLARSDSPDWVERWDALGRVPAAVRIQLLDAAGRPIGMPLVAHAALDAVL